jgi:ribosomal protein S12 methylthiotransferase
VREIVLIAQDTGAWRGKGSVGDLAELLALLAERHPATWLRVMYLQPQGITDALLDVMKAYENICNYLDMPLQHADAALLKEMNRQGSGEQYLTLLARIRASLSDVSLRTTMIAGFPGETRAQAKASERFLAAAAFNYVGVFAYSQEDGTPAGARRDQVPLATRRARAQRLRDIADATGLKASAAQRSHILDVLVCGSDEEGLYGRSQGMAPDVDGVIHLTLAARVAPTAPITPTAPAARASPAPGDIVRARIVSTVLYDLYGEVL